MNLLRFVQTPIEDRNLPFPETRVRSGELLRASQQGQLVHHLSDKGLRMIFPPLGSARYPRGSGFSSMRYILSFS